MSHKDNSGWVVRQALFVRSGRSVTSWWCGPDRSWGQTFGPLVDETTGTLSMSVAVFSTRTQAREAMAAVGLSRATPVPLIAAIDMVMPRKQRPA